MELNFKKFCLILASRLLSCNNYDDDIDFQETSDLSIAVGEAENPVANTTDLLLYLPIKDL